MIEQLLKCLSLLYLVNLVSLSKHSVKNLCFKGMLWLRGRDGCTEPGLLLSRKCSHSFVEVCRVLLGKLFQEHGQGVLSLC